MPPTAPEAIVPDEPDTLPGTPAPADPDADALAAMRADPKGYLVESLKDMLLDAHLHPTTTAAGEKLTRFDQGHRAGEIDSHVAFILALPGAPEYNTTPDTLKAALLGQALTAHLGG